MAKGNGKTGPKPYKTYWFRRRDPIMDELLAMKEKANMKFAAISKESGVATGTMRNWGRKGKTCRPQNASIEASGRALGKKRIWVDIDYKEGKK